jgi:hypothetical protein
VSDLGGAPSGPSAWLEKAGLQDRLHHMLQAPLILERCEAKQHSPNPSVTRSAACGDTGCACDAEALIIESSAETRLERWEVSVAAA